MEHSPAQSLPPHWDYSLLLLLGGWEVGLGGSCPPCWLVKLNQEVAGNLWARWGGRGRAEYAWAGGPGAPACPLEPGTPHPLRESFGVHLMIFPPCQKGLAGAGRGWGGSSALLLGSTWI
jgi:hypothetical protein